MDANQWNGCAGQYLTDWEQKLLDLWAADVFGFDALQLGHTQRLNGLAQNRCSQRWLIEPDGTALAERDDMSALVVSDFSELPFETDSIDLVILPHTLDDAPNPHAVLREVYRVLRPEGKMIILGHNPVSLWGLSALWARWRGQKWWPYQGKARPVHQLKDWLQLLNCDISQGKYGCYAPHVRSDKWLKRWHWLEDAGDRWWGMAGAVYAVIAVKHVYSPTLVGRINAPKNRRNWNAQPALQKSKE
ncbi:MAG: class I SAM-dependent methyltransferase [Formosimonas sp.]